MQVEVSWYAHKLYLVQVNLPVKHKICYEFPVQVPSICIQCYTGAKILVICKIAYSTSEKCPNHH